MIKCTKTLCVFFTEFVTQSTLSLFSRRRKRLVAVDVTRWLKNTRHLVLLREDSLF